MKSVAFFIEKPLAKPLSKILNFFQNSMEYNALLFNFSKNTTKTIESTTIDICVFIGFDKNNTQHKLIYDTLIKINNKQRIIEIQEKTTQCHFDKTCNECRNRNYISLNDNINLQSLINIIENFDNNICHVLANNNILNHLNHISFFSHLEHTKLRLLKEKTRIKKFEQNSIVFYQGDTINHFYFLLKGVVTRYVSSDNGIITTIKQYTSPSFINDDEALICDKFQSNIETLSKCEILYIEKDFFIDLIKNDSNLLYKMLETSASSNMNFQSTLINHASSNADYQIALKLLENPALLQYTKKTHLANELNIAPATLSRALNRLKKLEILNQNNEVINKERLKKHLLQKENIQN